MVAITSWVVDDWPFSMVKFLDYYTMIFNSDGTNVDLYEAYCGTDDAWVATKIIENISTINAPTVYPVNIDFADFGWFYAMAYAEMGSSAIDAKCFYRHPGVAAGTTCISALPLDSCPEFLTCCNFKGQALLGGIISTDPSWTKLGKCSVAWGAIGQFEFRPSRNRTAGYIKMPWSDQDEGLVLKVARLGDVVMVYGNGGRATLVPFSQPMATGYGLRDDIGGPGISKGFHFAGDKNLHGFIDTNNEFWVGGRDLKFNKLGYKEWIDALQVENDAEAADLPIIVSYSPNDRRFYIGGFSSGYVLTEYGLYSCHQSVTSIGRYRGEVLGGYFKDVGDYFARVSVDDSDFKERGLKTVDTVEYGVDYPSGGSGANMAPTSCCTDPDDDVDATTGWTADGGGTALSSIAGGVTGNCLELTVFAP